MNVPRLTRCAQRSLSLDSPKYDPEEVFMVESQNLLQELELSYSLQNRMRAATVDIEDSHGKRTGSITSPRKYPNYGVSDEVYTPRSLGHLYLWAYDSASTRANGQIIAPPEAPSPRSLGKLDLFSGDVCATGTATASREADNLQMEEPKQQTPPNEEVSPIGTPSGPWRCTRCGCTRPSELALEIHMRTCIQSSGSPKASTPARKGTSSVGTDRLLTSAARFLEKDKQVRETKARYQAWLAKHQCAAMRARASCKPDYAAAEQAGYEASTSSRSKQPCARQQPRSTKASASPVHTTSDIHSNKLRTPRSLLPEGRSLKHASIKQQAEAASTWQRIAACHANIKKAVPQTVHSPRMHSNNLGSPCVSRSPTRLERRGTGNSRSSSCSSNRDTWGPDADLAAQQTTKGCSLMCGTPTGCSVTCGAASPIAPNVARKHEAASPHGRRAALSPGRRPRTPRVSQAGAASPCTPPHQPENSSMQSSSELVLHGYLKHASQDVAASLEAEVVGSVPGASFVGAYRIEVGARAAVFEALRNSLEERRGGGLVSDRLLWHGTQWSCVLQILRDGFNRSFAGRNGMRLGAATYFSTSLQYSQRFCDARGAGKNGTKVAFVAQVLVGRYCKGSNTDVEPPIQDAVSGERYDSTVDSVEQPTIFAIFRDFQALPVYLVEFRV